MRDLEIRGAGNLLGAEQHGHMEAVGYDLYCKMLNEAVKHLKGEVEEEPYTTTVDLNVDAYIPASYIPNEYQKLDIYKRIAGIETEEEMDDMIEELIDRFGDIPRKVQKLLAIANLKAMAHRLYITAVEQKGEEYQLPCLSMPEFGQKKFRSFWNCTKKSCISKWIRLHISSIIRRTETEKAKRKIQLKL